eukprot:bmy_22695T0
MLRDVTACVCERVRQRARLGTWPLAALWAGQGGHPQRVWATSIAGEPPAGQHHGPLHHQPVPRRPGATQGQGHRRPGPPPHRAPGPPDRQVGSRRALAPPGAPHLVPEPSWLTQQVSSPRGR